MKRSGEQRDSEFTVFRVPTLVGLLFCYRKRPTKVGTLNTAKLYHRRQAINFTDNARRMSLAADIFNQQYTANTKPSSLSITCRNLPSTRYHKEQIARR